jgi:hypothetical protein
MNLAQMFPPFSPRYISTYYSKNNGCLDTIVLTILRNLGPRLRYGIKNNIRLLLSFHWLRKDGTSS